MYENNGENYFHTRYISRIQQYLAFIIKPNYIPIRYMALNLVPTFNIFPTEVCRFQIIVPK